MFHTYFGALDITLYIAAFFIALSWSKVIAAEVDQALIPVPAMSIGDVAAVNVHPLDAKTVVPTPIALTIGTIQQKQKATQPRVVVTDSDKQTDVAKTQHDLSSQKAEPAALSAALPTASDDSGKMVDEKLTLDLSGIRLYKLHKKSVVRVESLPWAVPESIRQYTLHRRKVVRLEDLEKFVEAVS